MVYLPVCICKKRIAYEKKRDEKGGESMALAVEQKKELVEAYKTHDSDTGSPEVQVAIIQTRIRELTEHFRTHRKDHHSRQGLFRLVSKQRRLLRYLHRQDVQRYRNLITQLGIRDTISGRRS